MILIVKKMSRMKRPMMLKKKPRLLLPLKRIVKRTLNRLLVAAAAAHLAVAALQIQTLVAIAVVVRKRYLLWLGR